MPGSWSSCDGRFKRSRLKLSAQIQTNAALIQTILQQCHVTCIKFPFSFFCPSRRRYRTLSILTIFDLFVVQFLMYTTIYISYIHIHELPPHSILQAHGVFHLLHGQFSIAAGDLSALVCNGVEVAVSVVHEGKISLSYAIHPVGYAACGMVF